MGTPTTGALSRVSYAAAYFDLAECLTDQVAVGTNGGTAYTRPGTVPARSDTVLVHSTSYNVLGWVAASTDPRGLVTLQLYDNLGRNTRVIEGYVDGVPSAADDRITDYSFTASSQLRGIRATLPGGAVQETVYVYQARIATGSVVNSNDVMSATQHPDPTTGLASAAQQEVSTVNALGERTSFTDRNLSTHVYSFDVVGRPTTDAVTVVGAGVQGAVRRLETAYDSAGRAYLFSSYSLAAGGTVVNQVQRTFNGYGQVTIEYQAVAGAVDTGTTPKVTYAYTTPSDANNFSRLTSMTYPNGRVLGYVYAAGLPAAISRVSALVWASATVESLSYLGLGTVVRRDHLESNTNLIYVMMTGEANGEAGDQYIGLDRFGRIVDQRWEQGASGHADRFQYRYDRNGNRLYKDNLLNNSFDELYHADGAANGYDPLNRLVEWQRGALSDTNADLVFDTVVTASHSQVFTMDAQGNFDTINTDGTPTARTHNAQNEILVAGAASLTYDSNGNLTTDELGQQLVFDVWNRLVRVKDSGATTIISYELDAVGRRIEEVTASTRDLYYSTNWQVLEERVAGVARIQNVWGVGYVDALVLRDRDADSNGSLEERLYVQQDANWNVTSITGTTGAVQERFAYDVYGSMTVLSPMFVTLGGTAFGWNIGHQGGRFEILVGLIHKRNNEYSPTLQTWVTPDDLRFDSGFTNWYAFVGNNPVNYVDPSGLITWDVDEKNYTITMKVTVKFIWKNSTISTWDAQRQEAFSKKFKESVEEVWNGRDAGRSWMRDRVWIVSNKDIQRRLIATTGARGATRPPQWCSVQTHWKPQLSIEIVQGGAADITAEVVANWLGIPIQSRAMVNGVDSGGINAWLDEADVNTAQKSFFNRQLPAAHEVGHLLGLRHPGPAGSDIEYTADSSGLLTTALETKPAVGLYNKRYEATA